MHSYCHNLNCRSKFSPTMKFGIGLEDEENAERWWSKINWNSNLALTRPENRRDFITALVDGKNESALGELPKTLRHKLKKAEAILKKNRSPPSRDFAFVKQSLIDQKRKLTLSGESTKNSMLDTIFDVACLIKKLHIKQSKKKGTKKTAIITRSIKSSENELDQLIKTLNDKHDPSFTKSDAFAQVSTDRLDLGLAAEIKYWKACEQILLTYNDISTSISHLRHLIDKLETVITGMDGRKVSRSQCSDRN